MQSLKCIRDDAGQKKMEKIMEYFSAALVQILIVWRKISFAKNTGYMDLT